MQNLVLSSVMTRFYSPIAQIEYLVRLPLCRLLFMGRFEQLRASLVETLDQGYSWHLSHVCRKWVGSERLLPCRTFSWPLEIWLGVQMQKNSLILKQSYFEMHFTTGVYRWNSKVNFQMVAKVHRKWSESALLSVCQSAWNLWILLSGGQLW